MNNLIERLRAASERMKGLGEGRFVGCTEGHKAIEEAIVILSELPQSKGDEG